MSRIVKVVGLAIIVVGVSVGCGKKPDPEPEEKAELQPAPAEKAKPGPAPGPAPEKVKPGPTPRPKPAPKPGPKPGPSPKQPDVIYGAYNEFNAKTQLRKMFFALAGYELTHKHYPAGIVGPGGDLGLSWRVAILPYLDDETGKLYKEFKLTEAWDSPHNKKLLTKMPAVFATPGTAASQGRTYYRAFAGPTAFIPLSERAPKGMNWGAQTGQQARGRDRSTITDGESNTLMVVQANEPVEWTRPDDLAVTDDAVPKLGLFQKEFLGLMCDGGVHMFPETVTEKSLRALVSTSAGDQPGPDTRILFTPPKK